MRIQPLPLHLTPDEQDAVRRAVTFTELALLGRLSELHRGLPHDATHDARLAHDATQSANPTEWHEHALVTATARVHALKKEVGRLFPTATSSEITALRTAERKLKRAVRSRTHPRASLRA